ncbi:MAG TPA: peptidoglycan-binding domain-containing protein, partial [Coleofasciculaceae cyanobacterium]
MWNRYGLSIAVIGLSLAASLVTTKVAFADRSRDYTPREMRSVLRGFGYNVTPGDTLDGATETAIRQFQQGYKLQVDGIPGNNTQNLAADLVKILKTNLNLVLEPSPTLPINQFYDSQTEAAVKKFQEKFNFPVTGIATLAERQRLDQEAKKVLSKPEETPSPSPTRSPSPTPSTSPSPSPSASPSPSPSPSPSASPSPSPSLSPSA